MNRREILFRGKRMDNGEWVQGDLVMVRDGDSGNRYPNIVISYNHDTFDWIEVDPSTIGQYTGLTDKNGVKIWEGDIVSTTWGNVNGDGIILWSVDEAMFKIKWITRIFKEIRGQSQNYTKDGEPILRNHSITLRVVNTIHDTHLNKQS